MFETDVIVVGAGHNGLTAGCYLQRAGARVLIVEASSTVGGMTSTNATLDSAPDHRFNEGAILATGVFPAGGVAAELGLGTYGLESLIVDPVHVQLGPAGDSLAIWADARRTVDELRHLSRHDAEAWQTVSEMLEILTDLVVPYMRCHPTRPVTVETLRSLLRLARGHRHIKGLLRLATAPHAEYIDETFEHPLTRGLLATMAAFARMTWDGTALASMLYVGVLQRFKSAMFAGGTGALPAALERCFEAHGGSVRTNAVVEEFLMRGNRVAGVRLRGGEELFAERAVITTCSPKVTLTKLLPAGYLPRELQTRAEGIPTALAKATSLKLNVALDGQLQLSRHAARRTDGLDLRRPLIGWHTLEEHVEGWEQVTRDRWPDPLPLGCCAIPTATDPAQAPPGKDTFWLWSGVVPVFPEEPWTDVRERVTASVLADCGDYFDGLDRLEIGRTVLGGPDLEERFNVPHGNVYHVDPLLMRFGPLRPALGFGGYRTPVPRLYLSGAGTHPTGGICCLPGKLAARTILRDARTSLGSPARRAHQAEHKRTTALAASRTVAQRQRVADGAGAGKEN